MALHLFEMSADSQATLMSHDDLPMRSVAAKCSGRSE